jgi:putative glycolipid-binding protein
LAHAAAGDLLTVLAARSRPLTTTAAWRHLEVRLRFEVLFLRHETDGYRLEGHSTAVVPVHRLGLAVGERADAPAVYIRAVDLRVERLEQSYMRLQDDGDHSLYDYVAPAFDYRAELVYDEFGLVLDYPGLAVRVA